MPKKHKRLTKHPKATKDVLEKARESAKKNDDYFLSEEGQVEMSQWKQESESCHGGARPGAGRKAGNPESVKQMLTTRLSPEILEFLRACEDPISHVIERQISRSKAFREWKKSHK